jgi:hypothetical protein
MRVSVRLAASVVAFTLAACGGDSSTEPPPSPLTLSVVADSSTAKGVAGKSSYQCIMTYRAVGVNGRPGDVAILTGLDLTVTSSGHSKETQLDADLTAAFFGVTHVGPGEVFRTAQAIASDGAPFTATLMITYEMHGAPLTTAPTTFQCT